MYSNYHITILYKFIFFREHNKGCRQKHEIHIDIDIDISVNCNWVDTQW
jgi:hypothetical protein